MRAWEVWLRIVWRVTGPAALGVDLLRALLTAAVLYALIVVTLSMATVTVQVRDSYVAIHRKVEAAQQTLADLKERALRVLPGKREPPSAPPEPVPDEPPSFGLPDVVWLMMRWGASGLPVVLGYWWGVGLGLAFLSFSQRRAVRRFGGG